MRHPWAAFWGNGEALGGNWGGISPAGVEERQVQLGVAELKPFPLVVGEFFEQRIRRGRELLFESKCSGIEWAEAFAGV